MTTNTSMWLVHFSFISISFISASSSFQFLLVKENVFLSLDWGKEKLSHGTVLNFVKREENLYCNLIYSSSLVRAWRERSVGKMPKRGLKLFTPRISVYRQRQWKYFLFSLSFVQPAIIYYLYRCFLLDFFPS